MDLAPYCPDKDRIELVRERRETFLWQVWEYLREGNIVTDETHQLSPPLVAEVIEHYINDWVAVKIRYRIEDKIMPHKVAGLMAASIMRYKPIIPIGDKYQRPHHLHANELLAIFYGVSVCGSSEKISPKELIKQPWFRYWNDEFVYLLRRRNHSPEALAFAFLTLSQFYYGQEYFVYEFNKDARD